MAFNQGAIFSGPQWHCPRCGSAQHGSHRYCSNCGGAGPLWRQAGCGASGCFGCLIVLGILAVLGVLVMSATVGSCLYYVAQPPSWDATVSAVSWERTIEFERIELRSKQGTKEEIPPDAIDVKQKGRTGIFTYKVREWGPDRTLRASGADHNDIRWPADTVGSKGLERDPNEREARREKYFVTMSYYGDQKVRFVVGDEATFRKFPLGSKHVITPMHGHVMINGVRYNH
jgi:hypothetical protein